MKIAVIGCGWQSHTVHGPCLRRYKDVHTDVSLSACCDTRSSVAEAYKNKFGFSRSYSDYREMLHLEKPDAVWVVVPPEHTGAVANYVMEAGVPLFLEKPPGMNKEEIVRLIDTAERHQIPHRVGFNRRYAPLSRKLVDKLHQEQLRSRMFGLTYDLIRINRRDQDFSTTAIHAIDGARWIAGSDYAYARFHYQDLPHIGPGVTNIVVEGALRSGAEVRLNLYPCSGILTERAVIRGEGFSFELNYSLLASDGLAGSLLQSLDGKTDVQSDEPDWLDAFGFYEEDAGFLNLLRAGQSGTWQDLRSSLQSVEIMERIRNRVKEYHV